MVAAQTVCCSFMCSCFALCVWNRCLSASTSHHYHSDTFIHICSGEFVDPRGVWLFGLLPGCIFHDLTVYVPLWNQNKHAGVKQPVCPWETGDTSSLIKQLQTATTLSDSLTHYSFPFFFFFAWICMAFLLTYSETHSGSCTEYTVTAKQVQHCVHLFFMRKYDLPAVCSSSIKKFWDPEVQSQKWRGRIG